jgi:hypothetical protein
MGVAVAEMTYPTDFSDELIPLGGCLACRVRLDRSGTM